MRMIDLRSALRPQRVLRHKLMLSVLVVADVVLALVGAVLVVAEIRITAGWRPVRRMTTSCAVLRASLPLRKPPSLHVLSISRT